jgi:uncharacterized membrane protein YbaN (DUF454 family)
MMRRHDDLCPFFAAGGLALTPLFWKLVAIVFIVFGAIGVFLPVVPTVPFLIVAAAAASRGWPWLDDKLTLHPRYGPIIVRWRERGAIARPAKVFATIGMVGGSVALWLVPIPPWLRAAVLSVMVCVGVWIWTRPER